MRALDGFVVVLAIALCGCVPQERARSADEAALTAVVATFVEAYNKRDVDGVTNLFSEDGVFLADEEPVRGRVEIHALMAKYLRADTAGIRFKADSFYGVGVSGELGWVAGPYSSQDASGRTTSKGKYMMTFQRIHGSWKVSCDLVNTDA